MRKGIGTIVIGVALGTLIGIGVVGAQDEPAEEAVEACDGFLAEKFYTTDSSGFETAATALDAMVPAEAATPVVKERKPKKWTAEADHPLGTIDLSVEQQEDGSWTFGEYAQCQDGS